MRKPDVQSANHRPAPPTVRESLKQTAERHLKLLLAYLQTAVRHWEARTSLAARRRQVLLAGGLLLLVWFAELLSVLLSPQPAASGLRSAGRQTSASIDSAYRSALRERGVFPRAALSAVADGDTITTKSTRSKTPLNTPN